VLSLSCFPYSDNKPLQFLSREASGFSSLCAGIANLCGNEDLSRKIVRTRMQYDYSHFLLAATILITSLSLSLYSFGNLSPLLTSTAYTKLSARSV